MVDALGLNIDKSGRGCSKHQKEEGMFHFMGGDKLLVDGGGF